HLYGLYCSSVSKGLGFSIIHDSRLDPVLFFTARFYTHLYSVIWLPITPRFAESERSE
ncbi:MAG: hypothetical protein ACI91R_002136, partial [Vicingaceae bacterium]